MQLFTFLLASVSSTISAIVELFFFRCSCCCFCFFFFAARLASIANPLEILLNVVVFVVLAVDDGCEVQKLTGHSFAE